MKSDPEKQRDVGAVVHAMRILQHLASAPAPQGVATIARETRISPSTCFSILRTMTRARFVSFRETDKTYSLGLAVAELSIGMIGSSYLDLIRPEIERLALNHGMLIALWRITEDGHIVVLDRAYGEHMVRVDMRIGSRLPALIGAVGRCVAARLELPAAELRRRFTTLRWQNAPNFEDYEAEVAQTAIDGWAKDVGRLYRGITTVASVIADQNGHPRFGISGIAIQGQHTPEQIDRLGLELRAVGEYVGRSLFPRDESKGLPAAARL
ncbi:MAG: IclR family transcriptional regulator [Alphaproteobacteria bacterium]|nr:IclR family transcriptional regulator [Alphaproteobacteria bacterium]MBU0797172.1 IclR family transcriptional regulator [Alphaproteobacteria bacterium]MBU0887157.1 IclR family transcriptional regulator [Alphaproteobacteria bacterium]MBU1814407.1 IclR family transcriptional regulator [Alphaproteobacteria bacterium]